MRRLQTKVGLKVKAGVAAMLITAGGAATAYDVYSYSPVPGAKVTWTTSNEILSLFDTACDSRTVYAEYYVKGSAVMKRIRNYGGCNTVINTAVHSKVISRSRACLEIPGGSDSCDMWRYTGL